MASRQMASLRLVLCALVVLLFAVPRAHGVPVATAVLSMQFEADGHTASWSTQWDITSDTATWVLPAPLNVYSSTNSELLLATVNSVSLSYDTDPFVSLGFNVVSGGAPTNFSISSAVVPLAPPITNGLAFATAGVTVTENPPFDGASLTGLFAGSKAYEARYNAGGSIFADLVSPVVVVPFGITGTGTEKFPPGIGTTVVIPGVVTDIESQFRFTLSANDQASGTSIFNIVPEPSSVVLAACGLIGLVWHVARRRRK
jgi:hypothetical protein